MQVLWERRINFKFGCKMEVRIIRKKLMAEIGQARNVCKNNSTKSRA
jgi:hypothetical protein